MQHIQDTHTNIPQSTPNEPPVPSPEHPQGMRLKMFGVASLLVASSVLLGESSQVTLQDYKPDGPYTASSNTYDYHLPDPVLIPGEPANALRLSDTWGGFIATTGLGITYDEPAIAATLGPRDVAIITQSDTTFLRDGTPETSTQATRVMPTDTSQMNNASLSDEQSDLLSLGLFTSTLSNNYLGGATDFAGRTSEPHARPLGDGILSHNDGTSEITYTRYHLNDDGTTKITDERTATATKVSNAGCDGIPNAITSEVLLTGEQQALICQILANYSAAVPADYSIVLNSGVMPYDANDSVNWGGKSIELTYPYIAGEQVPADELTRVALHEFLHTTYSDLAKDSPELQAVFAAYQAMVDAMQYKMPDQRTRLNSDTRISEVEPIWGTVTESTYLGADSMDGHPADNATEMISSMGAVMAFFPDRFMSNFGALQKYEQRAILQNTEALGSMIATKTAPGNIIPDYDALVQNMRLIAGQ